MHAAHAELFACPTCGGGMRLGGEGLRCEACRHLLPVRGGVVRALGELEGPGVSRTREDFEFQFRHFGAAFLREWDAAPYLREATGLGPEELRGKRVLDAGCGPGIYAREFARVGAEVVAVDFGTPTIERAEEVLAPHPAHSCVQADLARLPLRAGSLDMVFSVGVLHHTSDPAGNVAKLAALIKPGGILVIGVYSPVPWLGPVYDILRVVTTRTPPRMLLALTLGAVPLSYLPWLRHLAYPWCRPDVPWRIKHLSAFDWYRPRIQSYHTWDEVRGWLSALPGMEDVRLVSRTMGSFSARRSPAPLQL